MQEPRLIFYVDGFSIRAVSLSMARPLDGYHAIIRRQRCHRSKFEVFDAPCVPMDHNHGWTVSALDVANAELFYRNVVLFNWESLKICVVPRKTITRLGADRV